MKNILALAILLLFTTAAHSQNIRRVLLFASDSTNADLKQQMTMLKADSAGVVERDIWIATFSSPKEMRAMYEHYEVGGAKFVLLLVGKDGVEKYRSYKPVPSAELFSIIDEMPLRQADKQKGGKNK